MLCCILDKLAAEGSMGETNPRPGPVILLRIEAAGLLAILVWAYAMAGYSWWMFALLLLAPDLSMLGYLAGNRIGAIVYNLFHTYAGPVIVAGIAYMGRSQLPLAIAIVWAAHIALDRVLGYGLKYMSGFGATHLGRIGRAAGTE
jgi:hypothetical protein